MASALQSALAVGLEVVLQSIGIRTLDDLASGIRDRGDEIADCMYITSSSCRRAALVAAQERERAAQAATAASSAATAALQAATLAASAAEMEARLFRIELLAAEGMAAAHVERAADHSAHMAALLADVERLEALNSDVDLIDVWIAAAVVAEALLIGEQQAARETAARRLAEERACKLERELEVLAGLCEHAQSSAAWAAAERQDAELLAAREQAARRAMEQLLRAEAAAADEADRAASAAWARMRAYEHGEPRGGRGGMELLIISGH